MQSVLGGYLHKNSISYLLLGLYHALVNRISIILMQITPQDERYYGICASSELRSFHLGRPLKSIKDGLRFAWYLLLTSFNPFGPILVIHPTLQITPSPILNTLVALLTVWSTAAGQNPYGANLKNYTCIYSLQAPVEYVPIYVFLSTNVYLIINDKSQTV